MKFLGVILKLKFRELITLSGIFILSPLYLLPTIKASKNTLKNCNVRYGDTHHTNDRTNAYRHALWNLLLCEEIFRLTGSVEKSMTWAHKITDLHEELSPNAALEKAMDLHNNRMGRELFRESITEKINSTRLLDQKMGEAVQVRSIEEIGKAEKEFVYLDSTES